jgi:predicted RNA-binding protein YlxR (DUF448 family)
VIAANDVKKRGCTARGADDTATRTCVVTRAVLSPDDLVRFVAAPSGEVVPDIARKLPGRGVWVTCNRECVENAVAKKAFPRAFKRRVIVPDDLPERVESCLLQRTLQALSLANKAGLVVTGSGKVNSWIEKGAEGTLLQAVDASPDGLAKVARKYRAVCRATDQSPVELTFLTIDQLGLAMGQANVVHAALNNGRAVDSFLVAASRLEKYRGASRDRPALVDAGTSATG